MSQDVLIVHGQRVFREGLRRLLQERHDLRVVGEAPDGASAVALAADLRPALVLLDTVLARLNTVDVIHRICEAVPGVRIVVFGRARDSRTANRMINAGALAYLLPDADERELRSAIEAVLAGRIHVSPAVEQEEVSTASRGPLALTERQREVLRLMAEGRSTRQIAEALDVSVKTVETHRKHIMDRLEIRTVAELTKFAIREGITTL